jgi:hypothetical protein
MLLFEVNVQHACRESQCQATGRRPRIQERQQTDIEMEVVEHVDDTRFIINMHALHNAARLRKVLPRSITKPAPYHVDRIAAHSRTATALREVNVPARAAAKAQRDVQRAEAADKRN